VDADQKQVWAAVQAIYAAFLAGDRAAIDAQISPDATVWDSAHEPLLRGRHDLDAVRDARPTGGPRPSGLDAQDPVIDVFGELALVRHVLVVSFPPGARAHDERIRNTSVWRRDDGRWRCIHNHEDVVS
jgi:ketosteroid isomerase-like protein